MLPNRKYHIKKYIRALERLAVLLVSLSTTSYATYLVLEDLPVTHEASVEAVDKVYASTEYWRTVCAVASGSYGLFDRFENTFLRS